MTGDRSEDLEVDPTMLGIALGVGDDETVAILHGRLTRADSSDLHAFLRTLVAEWATRTQSMDEAPVRLEAFEPLIDGALAEEPLHVHAAGSLGRAMHRRQNEIVAAVLPRDPASYAEVEFVDFLDRMLTSWRDRDALFPEEYASRPRDLLPIAEQIVKIWDRIRSAIPRPQQARDDQGPGHFHAGP